jgi:hypothetical protein
VPHGTITAATGIGASVSIVVAGAIVVGAGYNAAFMSLGAIVGARFAPHLIAMQETAPAFGESDKYHSFARWSTWPPG